MANVMASHFQHLTPSPRVVVVVVVVVVVADGVKKYLSSSAGAAASTTGTLKVTLVIHIKNHVSFKMKRNS